MIFLRTRAPRGKALSLSALALAAMLGHLQACDGGDDSGDGGGGGGGGGDCDTRYDCNEDPSDGCESSKPCVCTPATESECEYDGPPGTKYVGICHPGVRSCDPSGTEYGACWMSPVLPKDEVCGNGLDDDCDGTTDAEDADCTP